MSTCHCCLQTLDNQCMKQQLYIYIFIICIHFNISYLYFIGLGKRLHFPNAENFQYIYIIMFYLFWSNKCSLNEHKNTFFQKKIQTLGPIFRILGHLKKTKKKLCTQFS